MIAYTNRSALKSSGCSNERIEAGQLGEIQAIRCGWLRHKGVPARTPGSRAARRPAAASSTGWRLFVDLALWLTGRGQLLSVGCAIDRTLEPRDEHSGTRRRRQLRGSLDVDVSASAFAVFAESFNLFVEASWSCSFPRDQTYLSVVGRRGAARHALWPQSERSTAHAPAPFMD